MGNKLQIRNELREIDNWDYDYINKLIDNKEKESIRLEYKGGDWLDNSPSGKCKLRKWVTSFSNSVGGFLVIGVGEDKKTREPKKDDIGVDKNKFNIDNEKWIFDILTNSIFPHLNPVPRKKIIQVPNTNREIVVLWIPQTIAVLHKVTYDTKDYYFYRFENQVQKMDEWLVRTIVFGKIPPPVFRIEQTYKRCNNANIVDMKDIIKCLGFELKVINDGIGIGKNIQIGLIHNPDIKIFNILDKYNTFETARIAYDDSGRGYIDIPSKEIFDIDKRFGTPNIVRIYDEVVLHSGDNRYFSFDITIEKDYNARKNNRIGVFILSENSRPMYYGIEFYEGDLGLIAKPISYIEGNKIKIE